jgi:hypothetical protein
MKPTTNPALERDALYAKSQVYIRRGLRAQAGKDAEEYQLWASLALELLGKAALANVHPALVADPTHSPSLFAACGRQLLADIRTIAAKTVFERLGHIDKTFDTRHQKFCEQMALRRNAELHSGESPFSGMSAEAWEREFWGAVEAVLGMQDETLETWLGAEGSKAPAMIIEQADEALQWAVKNRLVRCEEDFGKKYQDPNKRAQTVAESEKFRYWESPKRLHWLYDGYERHTCPACGSKGVIGGSLWSEEASPDQDEGDPTLEWVDRTFGSDEFFCSACELQLYGSREVLAAGLPEEFVLSDIRERRFEPEYGND